MSQAKTNGATSSGTNGLGWLSVGAGFAFGAALVGLVNNQLQDEAVQPIEEHSSVFINRSPDELYSRWLEFESFPEFMLHLLAVERTGERTSHWVAKGPAGTTVEWNAEITEQRPNELIAWRSTEGSAVRNSGSAQFTPAPGGRGTYVKVSIEYYPPAGKVGATFARLLREDPTHQLKDDLRRFKQVIETGEVTRSDATLRGAGQLVQRPAQPPTDKEIAALKI